LTNAECGTGGMCLAGVCQGGGPMTCQASTDCSADGGGATPYCTGPGGRCVQCLTRAQCGANARGCFGGRCF
jgi:hypothetical protein